KPRAQHVEQDSGIAVSGQADDLPLVPRDAEAEAAGDMLVEQAERIREWVTVQTSYAGRGAAIDAAASTRAVAVERNDQGFLKRRSEISVGRVGVVMVHAAEPAV